MGFSASDNTDRDSRWEIVMETMNTGREARNKLPTKKNIFPFIYLFPSCEMMSSTGTETGALVDGTIRSQTGETTLIKETAVRISFRSPLPARHTYNYIFSPSEEEIE